MHHAYRVEADRLHHMICTAAGISSFGDTPGNDDDVTEIGDEFDDIQNDHEDDKEEHVYDMTSDKKHVPEHDPYLNDIYHDCDTAPTQPESPILHVRTTSHSSSSGLSTAVADMHVSTPSPCPSPTSVSDASCHTPSTQGRKSQNKKKINNEQHSPNRAYRVSAKRKDDTNTDTPANKQRRYTATAIDTILTNNPTRAESADSFHRMILITMQQERQEAREREERREQRELEYKREMEERRIEESRREHLRQEQQERQHREFMIALFATITGKTPTTQIRQEPI